MNDNLVITNNVVKVKDHISALAMRAACDKLFNYIESLPTDSVTVDFDTFSIASRSFIHQYLMRKAQSKKRINEINLHPFLDRMFYTVKRQIEEDMRIFP